MIYVDSRTSRRFFASVKKNGPLPEHAPELGMCWEWQGYRNPGHSGNGGGYGSFRIGYQRLGNRRTEKAHRYSWVLHNGDIPNGQYVLHKCDNRGCVNPDHLFLGTHNENMRDMVEKSRGRNAGYVGAESTSAKLTESQVLSIRQRRKNGYSARELADEYGVCVATIHHIARRRTWRQLA